MSDTSAIEKLATDLEQRLGDPTDPATEVSFAAALEHDDREQYPHSMMAALHACELQEYQVPVECGGRAVDLQDSFEILRLIGRRDAGLATSFATTSLGFMAVLVGGSGQQRARYGAEVARGSKFAWALSERDHGSDIVATETWARKVDGGYLVNGEKWPIGNSALGDVLALFVRTAERSGPAAYSVLMLDRRTVPARCAAPLRRERLHGLRTLDNGGLRLTDCFIPEDARIGAEGEGLEISLKSSLAVRAVVPALAIGCADTALRRTLDFAVERHIFERTLVDIPHSRRRIAECFADLLVCDALAMSAVRDLHVVPDQSSITSSVSKYLVPTVLERSVSDLATVLGARHYLRSDPRYGSFGKVMRDLWIAHFAEGNTVVNLKNIAAQLGPLLDRIVEDRPERTRAAVERAAVTYDLDAELPPFRPEQLDLRSRSGDDALSALPDTLERITAELVPTDPLWSEVVDLGRRFLADTHRLRDDYAALRQELGAETSQSAELFALAEQYSGLHAGACLLHLVLRSAAALPEPFPDPALVLLGLERLWRRQYPLDRRTGPTTIDRVIDLALGLHEQRRLFSHRRVVLGEASTPGDGRSDDR